MSIFTRPASPPPRQPSPDFVPAPLPSPHLRSRLRPSSSKQSLSSYSPPLPPGLPAPRPHKPLTSARSYDHLDERLRRTTPGESHLQRRPRPNLTVSPPSTPCSLPVPFSPYSAEFRPHRRVLSNAIPYRSPPPSPTIASPPPPVPPIPAFVLTPPADLKKHRSQTFPKSIHLPELGKLPPRPDQTRLSKKPSRSSLSPDKQKSAGMTCMKFFSLRNTR